MTKCWDFRTFFIQPWHSIFDKTVKENCRTSFRESLWRRNFNLQNDGGSSCEKKFLTFSRTFEFLQFSSSSRATRCQNHRQKKKRTHDYQSKKLRCLKWDQVDYCMIFLSQSYTSLNDSQFFIAIDTIVLVTVYINHATSIRHFVCGCFFSKELIN